MIEIKKVSEIGPTYIDPTDGQEKQIDLSVVKSTREGFSFENTKNSIRTYFKNTLCTYDPVVVESEQGTLSWQLLGISYRDGEGNEEWLEKVREESVATKEDNKVIYTNSLSGVEDVFEIQPGMLKHSTILHTLPKYSGKLGEEVFLCFESKLDFPSHLKIVVDDEEKTGNFRTSSAILLHDEEGNEVFKLLSPVIFEQENPEERIVGFYEVTVEENFIIFLVGVPYTWLSDEGRKFPVVVDPTIADTSTISNYWFVSLPHGEYFFRVARPSQSADISLAYLHQAVQSPDTLSVGNPLVQQTLESGLRNNPSLSRSYFRQYGFHVRLSSYNYAVRIETNAANKGPIFRINRTSTTDRANVYFPGRRDVWIYFEQNRSPYIHKMEENGSKSQHQVLNTTQTFSYASEISPTGLLVLHVHNPNRYVLYKIHPDRPVQQMVEQGEEGFTWADASAIWDASGTVAAFGGLKHLYKVEFPSVNTEVGGNDVLPSGFVAFHPHANIIIMQQHVCYYDPDTLELYDIQEHGISLLENLTLGVFTKNGRFLVARTPTSSTSYVFEVKANKMRLFDDNYNPLAKTMLGSRPLNLGIIEAGEYGDIRKVQIFNGMYLPIGDIEVKVNNDNPDLVEVSKTDDPFEPAEELHFAETLMPNESTEFYVRAKADENNPLPVKRASISVKARFHV